ncbi:tetraspanin-1-like [Sphaeramia orbicularis]|uniref:Tetraspanin n=1 Tax=Sphaeramia orbicularis TaxID=375764 RepID=A0A673CY39_9TELE|nr:tetraspanin-1-like [Sphaeramia orbicularis]XP_030000852.1 tetraspanin-1-like [Sphaeramia orbicularis]
MCCKGFLKIMMFIFNGAIFLAGAAILGVGVWAKVDTGSLLGFLSEVDGAPPGLDQLVNVSYLLIAVGAVLLVIGFLGCCGAIRESRCMLLMFFCIVLIIFIAEVAGAVILLVYQGLAEDLVGSLENQIRKDISENYGPDNSVTSLWNATMKEFKCCGFTNYTDFDESPYYTEHGGLFYPVQCCNGTLTENGPCSKVNAEISNVDGCYSKLVQFIEENAVIIAAVALGIAALEVAAMVVSMILYTQVGSKD